MCGIGVLLIGVEDVSSTFNLMWLSLTMDSRMLRLQLTAQHPHQAGRR